MALVKAHRMHGHLAARLDPLGSEPVGDPALEPERLEPPLTPELQAQIPAHYLRLYVPGETLADALPALRETYCGTIAYEIEHISDHEERVWLRQAVESGRYRQPLSADEKRGLLERLTEVEVFERYLQRAFLGQKQFSVEGLDSLVPLLDEAVELAAENGAHRVVLGMAHRGRLSVIVHTLGRPYEYVLLEFEGERTIDAVVSDPEGGTGDVKYHLGADATRTTRAGEIQVTLASNPSHLEAVDPVVEGMTRAEQTDRGTPKGLADPVVAMPVLIHGDAAFPAQGVVAETLNLQALRGYSTGGTLHVIANNQVGFTTDPGDARSTRHSSDLAKGFDVPIIHVNADDPEAALAAVRLADAFRSRFSHDVVIDLVGYRRHGHNEQDEPAYTQPLMAQLIDRHPPARELYAQRLIDEGVVTEDEAQEMVKSVEARIKDAHEHLREEIGKPSENDGRIPRGSGASVITAVSADRLRELNNELLTVPDDFKVHPKLVKQLLRRGEALESGGIDWGHAEALAFASLLVEGIPIRLSGQDTERGTFSHRHIVLHDAENGGVYTPIQHLRDGAASFEVYNSPLSEYAAVGFEYGYSVSAPEALVLWEAQFGDFVNGAQIAIDQFIVAGLSKWAQTSRLTLLLPHGYEGNGPEHSSARLERFLQLAAQENIRIVNPTTAAQSFHLLRRQALDPAARPLVVMTPKGLLRLRQALSSLSDLSEGSFQPVIDDPDTDHAHVRQARPVERQGLLRHRRPRAPSRRPRRRRRPGRAALPVPGRGGRRARPALQRAAGDRLGPGGAAEHGRLADEPPPPRGGRRRRRRLRPLRRPPLARKPERGLPDGPPARAGPDRPRSPDLAKLPLTSAPVRKRSRGGARCLLPRRVHDHPALRGRQPTPDLERRQREAHRSRSADARHACIQAEAPYSGTCGLRLGSA